MELTKKTKMLKRGDFFFVVFGSVSSFWPETVNIQERADSSSVRSCGYGSLVAKKRSENWWKMSWRRTTALNGNQIL